MDFASETRGDYRSQRRKPDHLISILPQFHQGLLYSGILLSLVILLLLSKGR